MLRHRHPSEIALDLARFRSRGYTGVWIENDYVRWTTAPDPDEGFDGCWRLFNIFDFTFSNSRGLYEAYLDELSSLCARHGLEIWASFWLPIRNAEMMEYLKQNIPGAIGQFKEGENQGETLCTCSQGQGLTFITQMVERFMDRFPQVRGLKIATGDNGAAICDETCPNAHGTTRAQHAGNLFGTIDAALHRAHRPGRLMLYPWYWEKGYSEEILARLQGDYLVMTKMEENSHQALEPYEKGDPIFDDSIVSEQAGPDFLNWRQRVGAERIIDMAPTGSGVDDMFFNYPPYPGRLYRRFRQLRQYGVRRFLDYECGGHAAGSNEEAVAVFAEHPGLGDETEFLRRVAQRLYRHPQAQAAAIEGWREFDRGFGQLPIGLGQTGSLQFSGRFGFAWPMCIATPLVADAIGNDRWHKIFWFSPYNFFSPEVGPRLQVHFLRVLERWQASLNWLSQAARLEDGESSRRERDVVQAHVLGVGSVLNWCTAADLAGVHPRPTGSWAVLAERELRLTEDFQKLRARYAWIWANNCWHPLQTPLHQKTIGFTAEDEDPFVAKLRIMRAGVTAG